jgi:transcriptional regulator with XRE-family HTH domain
MDWKSHLQEAKARRGLGPVQSGQKLPWKALRKAFVARLAELGLRVDERRGRLTYREFAEQVGLPHSTVNAWVNIEGSQPTLADLRAIATNAEHPGVPRGRLSVDWLCGLSEEPNREARAEFGQLRGVLAAYVASEFVRRVPRDSVPSSAKGFWNAFVSYWRTDGEAIIEQAIEGEIQAFQRASEGLDELGRSERAIIEKRLTESSPISWPDRSQSREQRQAARGKEQQHRRGLAGMLVHELTHAEFIRRINKCGAPLIYDPGLIDRQRAEVAKATAQSDGRRAAEEKNAPSKRTGR